MLSPLESGRQPPFWVGKRLSTITSSMVVHNDTRIYRISTAANLRDTKQLIFFSFPEDYLTKYLMNESSPN